MKRLMVSLSVILMAMMFFIPANVHAADISSHTELCSMSVSRSGTTLTVNAALKPPYTNNGCIGRLYVDNTLIANFDNRTIKLSNYRISLSKSQMSPGPHTATVSMYVASTGQYAGDVNATYYGEITERPTYRGQFEVYHNYLYYRPYNMAWENTAYDLYLEYSPDGKNWQRSGYMRANAITLMPQQTFTINGLQPGRTYATRIRYGKLVNGKLYLGPAVGTGSYKTGQAKPLNVKSVTCKAVKVKRHKVKHYGYYTGVYLYTEKFYTYKVKVTVKLKKKPNAAGIWINGKFCKGNKKKYTATFTPQINYSKNKPKGRKWGVALASYQSSAYGGYSPLKTVYKRLK